jgi:hypothetical protein
VNSEYGEALISLALTMRQKGMDDKAESILHRLVEIDPGNLVARNLIADGFSGFDAG